MAASRDTTAEHIKPLEGAIVRRVQLGATTEAGELITEQSDGKWDPTNTGGVQFTVAVALQGGVDTDSVDAVFFGPVVCMSGATKGALIYATDTAGEPGESTGTKGLIAGFAESATVLFVQKQIVSFS
jgi:hypothetical protein